MPKKQSIQSKQILDVEIIVRCYNEEDWIYDCIKAIEYQNYLPSLVTIVDNESTDSTALRAEWLAKNSSLTVQVERYTNSSEGYRPGKILNHFCLKSKFIYTPSASCDIIG